MGFVASCASAGMTSGFSPCRGKGEQRKPWAIPAAQEGGLLRYGFRVESGNQQILNNIGKGITLQQTRDAFKLAHRARFDEIWVIYVWIER